MNPQDPSIAPLFDRIRDAAIVADVHTGRIVFWNPAAESLLGYSAAEALGLTVDALIPERLRRRHATGLARYRATGHGRHLSVPLQLEQAVLRKTGEELPVELTLTPIAGPPVEGRLVLAIVRDAAERQRADAEQAQLLAREQAARAEAEAVGLLNARLVVTALAAGQRLEALYEATKQVSSSLDLDQLFATVFDATRRVLAADRVSICQKGESNDFFCRASSGLSTTYLETTCHLFVTSPIVDRAVATRSPALIEDLLAVPPVPEAAYLVAQAIAAEGMRAVLALPLFRYDELIGVLSIYHDQPRHYTAEDLQVAQTLANQVAIAIDNANLYQTAQLRAQEVEALHEATKQITHSLDLTTTINSVLSNMVRLSGSDFASVRLLDAARGMLDFEVAEGRLADLVRGGSFRLGEGLVGIAAQTNQVINVPDAEHEPRIALQQAIQRAGIRSILCLPMRSGEGVLGVLTAMSQQPAYFTPARERLLVGLTEQAALAIVHAREIGERKQVEEALRASERRFRDIATTVPDWIWEVDAQGCYTYSNPSVEKVTGYAVEEMLGQHFLDAIHAEDRPKVAELVSATWQARCEFRNLSSRYLTRDGRVVWLECSGIPLLDIEGKLVGYRGVDRDVTERRAAEARARFLSEASSTLAASLDYESTVERVANLVVPALADWCLVDIADQGRSLLQVVTNSDPTLAALVREMRSRFPPDPNGRHPAMRVLRTGRAELTPEVPDSQLVDTTADPEYLAFLRQAGFKSSLIVPLLARGRTLGAMTFMTADSGRRYDPNDLALAEDLAHRCALAIDNARLYREAQEAVHARNDLLSIVSHDLKNPLAAIKGYAQALQVRIGAADIPGASTMLKWVANVDASTTRMAAQIDELLEFARMQAGQPLKLHYRPTDLVALACQVADQHQQAASGHRIRVEATTPELTGMWDSVRLERVLANLLNNAIKYSPIGGEVAVTVGREPGGGDRWAVLTVRDQGLGIPAADLPYVFERFRRAGNVGGIGGTGIGLASARRIVEEHAGTIAVASEEGAGSTFTIRLPLAPPRPRAP